MNRRVRSLLDAGMFKLSRVNKLGHGTFLDVEISRSTSVEQAKALKREADGEAVHSRERALRMHLDAVLLYTRGYWEETGRHGVVENIHRWKSLAGYVGSSMRLAEGCSLQRVFGAVLFNIKFHYLHLEASLMSKQHRGGKSGSATQLLYFLREYNSMHEMVDAGRMAAVRPGDLEELVRGMLDEQ